MLREIKKPEGASFYISDGRNEFIVWAPPTGDKLCFGVTGRSESQLVREILEGRWDKVMHGEAAAAAG